MNTILFIVFIFISRNLSFSYEANSDSLTKYDLNIIEYADYNSVNDVFKKIRKIYSLDGVKAISSAIEPVCRKILNVINKGISEEESECMRDYLWLISISGDQRVKPVLIRIMCTSVFYGYDVPKGFLRIGQTVIPELCDSLSSKSTYIKESTALTLSLMCEFDSTGIFFSEKDKKNISERLLNFLYDKQSSTRRCAIEALGYFGDISHIPLLEKIEINDPYISETEIYINRIEAEKSIKKINERIK